MEICAICGRPATDTHHLIFGYGLRKLADEDDITIKICRVCHAQIHETGIAENLSKMLGQTMWESKFGDRDAFRKRYGRSWL